MPLPEPLAADLRAAGVPLVDDLPLARKTWWRVGGPADGWAEIGDPATLSAAVALCRAAGVPVFPMGNASNLLIADAGIRGLVIRLTEGLAGVAALPGDPPELEVGGGLRLVSLLGRAQKEGWTGLEMLAGVPGTIGGAVRTNAGTRLGELSDALRSVTILEADGHGEDAPGRRARPGLPARGAPSGRHRRPRPPRDHRRRPRRELGEDRRAPGLPRAHPAG
jgi:UDP-N-acetylenolpyruvoylglucosamine reductase